MKELNNQQLILLSLLVSFVTSIATGIVTVTLLAQAPQGVTQTINQVVERTIEKVVPGDIKTVVKEVPVIVTQEELIVKAINSTSGLVVRIVDYKDEKAPKAVASGFLTEGSILISVLPAKVESETGVPVYKVVTEGGKSFSLDLVKTDENSRLVIFKVKSSEVADFTKETEKIVPLKLSSKDTIVGQTIIGVGATSAGTPTATVSIVSNISTGTDTNPAILKTNAASPDNLGGPLLDIHGEVVGVSLSSGSALAKTFVKSVIDSIPK
jgi:S1-C subfamily serine protease